MGLSVSIRYLHLRLHKATLIVYFTTFSAKILLDKTIAEIITYIAILPLFFTITKQWRDQSHAKSSIINYNNYLTIATYFSSKRYSSNTLNGAGPRLIYFSNISERLILLPHTSLYSLIKSTVCQ